NRPPVGCVSRWLPVTTGGRSGSRPGRRAKMLPILSTATVQPASSHQRIKRRRASPSRSLAASRQTPPFAVAPIRASSIRLAHSRSPLIVRLRMTASPAQPVSIARSGSSSSSGAELLDHSRPQPPDLVRIVDGGLDHDQFRAWIDADALAVGADQRELPPRPWKEPQKITIAEI